MTEQIKSSTTGKTACDFLRVAFAQIALDVAEVARQMLTSSVNVYKWRAADGIYGSGRRRAAVLIIFVRMRK